MARAILDTARQHWTDEKLQAFGHALARCAQKYGWTKAGMATHPLALLALATVPLAWPFIEPHVKALLPAPKAPQPQQPTQPPRAA